MKTAFPILITREQFLLKMKLKLNSKSLGAIEDIFSTFPESKLVILDKFKAKASPQVRQAAVFIPLCHRHGEPHILFTVRSSNVGTHKGQVSFPGGHIDAGETPQEAAIREMFEEIGTHPSTLRILGVCQTIPAITGTLVTPVLGMIEEDVGDFEHLKVADGEVSSVFTRSVEQLLEPNYRQYEILHRGSAPMKMPFFGEKASAECIWGLTGMILSAVLDKIISRIPQ